MLLLAAQSERYTNAQKKFLQATIGALSFV
jgi:hypothetical protein